MEVNETSEDEDDENNVFINAQLLIENRMSSIPYIVNNKTSNRNTSRKTLNQRDNSIARKSKKLAFAIGDTMIKDVDGYLLTGSLNRKYILTVRPFSYAKTSDI